MEMTHSFIDVAAFDGTGQPPHEIIEKGPIDHWLVASSPIAFDKPVDWSIVRQDNHVMIPLVPYLLNPEPAAALAFMLQLGIRTAQDVKVPIRRLHIAIGMPVHDLSHAWQFQVGFGLQTK